MKGKIINWLKKKKKNEKVLTMKEKNSSQIKEREKYNWKKKILKILSLERKKFWLKKKCLKIPYLERDKDQTVRKKKRLKNENKKNKRKMKGVKFCKRRKQKDLCWSGQKWGHVDPRVDNSVQNPSHFWHSHIWFSHSQKPVNLFSTVSVWLCVMSH